MPELDLSRALRIGHMGHEVTQLGHLGQTVWTAAAASPVISITSGSGYAGSVYSSTVAGQWYADDVAISGETGSTLTMTAALEGKAIRCGGSNVIQMWTPAAVTSGRVAWLSPRWSQTIAAGKIVELPDRWGANPFSQTVAASQLSSTTINGYAAALGIAGVDAYLQSGNALIVGYAFFVASYTNTGGLFTNWSTLLAQGAGYGSFQGRNAAATWNAMSARSNGGNLTTSAAAVLSGKSIISAVPRQPTTSIVQRIGMQSAGMGWIGPIYEAILLTTEPDTATRQQIEGYLAHAQGLSASLPAAHPYRTNAPRIA